MGRPPPLLRCIYLLLLTTQSITHSTQVSVAGKTAAVIAAAEAAAGKTMKVADNPTTRHGFVE